MTLDGIEVFVKVIQAGSFSKAAALMHMPVTTVSGKVAALEKKLGLTLIHRTTRKLALSQEGEIYFKHCVRALQEVEAAMDEMNINNKEGPTGVLRITAPADIARVILFEAVESYLKKYKNMKIELILTNRLVDLVSEGVDLAIRVGQLKDSTLIAKTFIDTRGSMWATPEFIKKFGTPRTIRSLKDYPFVRFPEQKEGLILTNDKEVQKIEGIEGRITVDDMETMKKFVLSSHGIGIIPDFLCRLEEESGKLIRVLPNWHWGNLKLSFVYPPQRFVSLKLRTFIDWLEKEVRA